MNLHRLIAQLVDGLHRDPAVLRLLEWAGGVAIQGFPGCSDIPILGDKERDRAARFIRLADVLYDHTVNLVASAAAAPTGLYVSSSPLAFDFARMASRLEEMRSHDYSARSHLS